MNDIINLNKYFICYKNIINYNNKNCNEQFVYRNSSNF